MIDGYLSSKQVHKLQIGSGAFNLPNWLNTDIEPGPGQVYLDATKPFPLPDCSVAYIFGEHVIEHLTYDEGLAMLRECHRVLTVGGTLRLATPDLRRVTALLEVPPNDAAAKSYIRAKFAFHGWAPRPEPAAVPSIINGELREWGHQFVYDEATLRDSLSRAGFQEIKRFAPGESDDPNLVGIEQRHNSLLLREVNDYESMVIQARRL